MVDLKPKKKPAEAAPKIVKGRFQFKHLLLFILSSALVHGLLLFLFTRYETVKPVEKSEASKPIDFIVVPPEEPSPTSPKENLPEEAKTPVPENIPPPTPEPEPEPTPQPQPEEPPSIAQDPEPEPEPTPKPQPAAEDLKTGSDSSAPTPQPEKPKEQVATRVPAEPQPPSGGSAADLLGGNYQKTLANNSDAFFSPEALSFKSVLDPQQIKALKDFDLENYGKKVQEKTRPHWHPDRYSPEEYTTVLTFNILPNGQVTELQVSQSSGSAKFDQIALDAIKNAMPFPPLPADFPLESLPFQFSFNLYQY